MIAKAKEVNNPQGLNGDKSMNPDTKEYKLSTAVSSKVSEMVSYTIGDVLDMMEASLPDTKQTDMLKQIVRERLYKLTREIQHQVYYSFGVEPYQLGDSHYIKDVLDGIEPSPAASPARLG